MCFRIRGKNRFRLSCWIPLFLLWPILAVMVILLLPLIILTEVILRLSGHDYRLCRILIATYDLVAALRGLRVDVQEKSKDSMVYVNIT